MTKQDSAIEYTMAEQDFLYAIDFIGQQYFYLDDEYPYCDIEFSTKDEDYQKLELSQKTLIADNVNTDEYRHSIVKGFNNSLSAETHFYFTNKKCCLYCFMLILRI